MAKFVERTGLTFDDVCLVPVYNNVASRTEPSLKSKLSRSVNIKFPVVNSPMSTVISPQLAGLLSNKGIVPIFHRFFAPEKQLLTDIEEYLEKYQGSTFFISVGTKPTTDLDLTNIAKRYDRLAGICLDVAHGHSSSVIDAIKRMKDTLPFLQVIAGNVCTARGTFDLINAGADAVRVGIGPGSNCSTRMVTGFGSPQLTALMECAEEASRHDVPVISDGGIRDSRDVVIALAAGASSVMLGRLLAGTVESAAIKVGDSAIYKGQASRDFQRKGMAPEGVERRVRVSGSANDLIDQLMAGVRSGLTYGGARDILELQRKAVFMPVSSTYLAESKPRD